MFKFWKSFMHVYVMCMLIVPSEIHGNAIQIFQTNSGTSLCILWEKRTVLWFCCNMKNTGKYISYARVYVPLPTCHLNRYFSSLNIGECNTLLFKIHIKLNQASITIESESVVPVFTHLQRLSSNVLSLLQTLKQCLSNWIQNSKSFWWINSKSTKKCPFSKL